MGDMVVKDNFNGFSENCTEMGNSFGLFTKQSDEETQIVSHISPSKDTISSECKKFNVIDIDKKKACTAPRTQCIAQKCDFVHNCGTDESKAKLKEMQSNWIELHKCIRIIYKNAISSVPCIVANEEIPKRVSDSVKVLIEKLCEEDCQQLFIRVEVLVRDFVLEAKDRLKDLQNNVEDIPVLYLRGLLASYGAFCVAADNLAPFIPQLDALLMKRFSVNFQLLNKYLFQTCLYADSFVQNNVPLYISQLRTSNSGTHFTNQELVHSYLAFDDEMTDIASRWLDVKKMILKLSKKRVISNCKQPLLLEDWKMYREHRELAASRTWQLRSQKRETSEFDVQLLSLLDDITNHMCELEISSNKKQVFNTCRSCNSDISCSCDDCTIKHIFSCVETPPTSPDHNSSDNTHSFNSAELLEQFKAMSKVNKIQMPKNFFKLITDKVLSKSFVQSNDGESVIEEVKPEIQTPKIPVTPPEANITSSNTAAPPPATSKVPVSTNVANSITNSTHVHNSQTTNTSIIPSSDKSGRILKEVTKSTQNKMAHCNHQYQVVKKAKEQQTCKEGCAEHGPVKNQKESKRCDCPHCEVFENSNAQTTTKNNKTRDRLRIRLNEKRNKALKEKGTTKNVEPPKHKDQENIKITKSGLDTPTCVNSGEVEDTRDIKELIDFIEGTDRNAKFLNAQKRLAKKARRRERKLEEERLKEQERLRIEAEILLEEQRRLEEIKRQEEARLREQQQAARNKKKNKKSKDKQNKGNHHNNNNNSNSNNNNNSNTKGVKTIPVEVSQYIPPALNEKLKIHSNGGSGGPMVTIKRVMEHSSSEPTVTITLKGSTPDKDKLLYTLVNGHTNLVKSVEDVTKPEPLIMTKSQKKKAKKEQKQLLLQQQQLQQQQQQQKQQQLQNIENNKTLSKKERKKLRNELNIMQNQKNQQNTNNIKIDSTNEIKKKNGTTTTQSNIITSTSTNTNSINISNNNNNNNTIKNESPLNLQMLRLPPGITITKVDGPAVNRKIRINSKSESQTPTPPPIAAPVQSSDNRSGVIVVDTVKLKQVLPVAEQPHPQTAVTTTTSSLSTTTTTTSKKKKKKNKNKSDNTNTNQNQNQQQQQQQNIQLAYKMPTDGTTMKGSNTNGNSIVTIKNPMFYQLQESLNGKMNKQKLIENVTTTSTTTIKDARPQQASIIKGANGMVTIRSPRLNGNIPNGHSEIPVGIPDLKPVLGPNTSVYKPAKTETNNKPFNAQEILSGLPGIEITKINKNSTKSKNDCKVFQPADVSIIPTNLGNGTNGDVYKLFSDNTDWTLESVFAPKDLKEDEELDADELELEAFKRFCQQSVPPERKEKVAHLNVKDIVLKKKNSNNICS